MNVIDFLKVFKIKKRAEAHADKMLPLIQAEIPVDLRVPDDELHKLLVDTNFETEMAVANLKGDVDGGD